MGAKLAENLPVIGAENKNNNSAHDSVDILALYDSWLDSITFMIDNVCESLSIENLATAPQTQFNAVLKVIGRKLFMNNPQIKHIDKEYNLSGFKYADNYGSYSYNTDALKVLLDLLVFLCDRYDKAVSFKSFGCLCGMSYEELYNWLNGNMASEKYFNFSKSIKELREQSLTDILTTAKRNPVSLLGVMNREFNWNMPGVTRETRKTVALDANNLPFLGDSGSRETLPGVVSSSFSPKEKLATGGEGASGQK